VLKADGSIEFLKESRDARNHLEKGFGRVVLPLMRWKKRLGESQFFQTQQTVEAKAQHLKYVPFGDDANQTAHACDKYL
jgi:hypothetical protein